MLSVESRAGDVLHSPPYMSTLNFAIVGSGGITLQNHLPGLALCRDVRVTALCDSNAATLETARAKVGDVATSTNYEDIVKRDDVHAVIIATPNFTHKPIALAAIAHGKHVLCEKPIALNAMDAREMAAAADAAGVRHMTAFTYRFVPAMRYLGHLIAQGDLGTPYHYRSCRLQDWGTRNLGWRQQKALAGTGELGDMLSHRINFAQHLVGPMKRIVANVKNLTPVRGGAPNDTEDWVAILADFTNGATGVLESSKLASGRNESWRSLWLPGFPFEIVSFPILPIFAAFDDNFRAFGSHHREKSVTVHQMKWGKKFEHSASPAHFPHVNAE